MFNKAINFIKYNNFTVLIIAFIFLAGSGVFAATDAGQEIIGGKQTEIMGEDNRLLLDADLDDLNMDFQIERIENDEKYYYVIYTYLDMEKRDGAWQYQINEKTRKVSKKIDQDLGEYLAEELYEQYEARIKDLKREQAEAKKDGETVREEVTEYSGLIGQSLALAERVFSGYEPVKVRALPTPTIPPTFLKQIDASDEPAGAADDMTLVYENYILKNDPDGDNIFGSIDNCPNDANPLQEDEDEDGLGDACDEFFTLKPVIEPEASTTPETATTTEDETVVDPEERASTSEETVEIIELPVGTGTSTE